MDTDKQKIINLFNKNIKNIEIKISEKVNKKHEIIHNLEVPQIIFGMNLLLKSFNYMFA